MKLKSGSQNQQILRYLLAGNTLTALESGPKFGCLRLGARVYEINKYLSREVGVLQIIPEMVTVLDPAGNRKRVAQYKLVEIF